MTARPLSAVAAAALPVTPWRVEVVHHPAEPVRPVGAQVRHVPAQFLLQGAKSCALSISTESGRWASMIEVSMSPP